MNFYDFSLFVMVGQAALVELQIMGGGQKHQLRVHCSEILKTPIMGDLKYDGFIPPELEVSYIQFFSIQQICHTL